MSIKYTIHWSDKAIESLTAIEEFISQVSPSKAVRVVRELVIYARHLLMFPYMGVTDERFGNDNLRKLIKGEHLLVYEVRGTRIEIINVFSGKQDFQARFISEHEGLD